MSQLSLFNDTMPHGDIQSDMFERDIRKVQIDGEWHFSIFDIFEHYGSHSGNPRTEWKRAKQLLEKQGYEVVARLLQHQFEGSGQRKTPVVTMNQLMRIAQAVTFRNWEQLRQWMADLAAKEIKSAQAKAIDKQRLYSHLVNEGFNHDEAIQWIDARTALKTSREEMTRLWQAHAATGRDFAQLTNDVTEVATGQTATKLKRQLQITTSPRDYLSAAQNVAIRITEFTAGILHQSRESVGVDELSQDIHDVRPIVDAARPEIERAFSKKPRRLKGQDQPKLLKDDSHE